MHIVQERLEQSCSELPGLKLIDSAAVPHAHPSATVHPQVGEAKVPS